MARKKETPTIEQEAQNAAVEQIEEVSEPRPIPVAEVTEPEAALSAASRQRNAKERERASEEYVASRNARQENAIIVGRYITAQRQKNVATGKISGVEVKGEHVFWVIYDGPVTVYIPFQEALPFLEDETMVTTPDARMRQRQMMSKSVGAVVPFSVEQIIPSENETYLVYGSRKNAMERIRKRYFGKDAANPAREGDVVVGTFLGVGPHAAWVNILGVDVRMRPRQLSHRYMDNLMEEYTAGEEIRLRIQKIEAVDGKLRLIASALPCELEACRSNLSRVRRGIRYAATITSHRLVTVQNPKTRKPESRYIAAMWLEGVEVPAFANVISSHASGMSHSGDRVMVEVEEIARNGYVRCRIIAYLP